MKTCPQQIVRQTKTTNESTDLHLEQSIVFWFFCCSLLVFLQIFRSSTHPTGRSMCQPSTVCYCTRRVLIKKAVHAYVAHTERREAKGEGVEFDDPLPSLSDIVYDGDRTQTRLDTVPCPFRYNASLTKTRHKHAQEEVRPLAIGRRQEVVASAQKLQTRRYA